MTSILIWLFVAYVVYLVTTGTAEDNYNAKRYADLGKSDFFGLHKHEAVEPEPAKATWKGWAIFAAGYAALLGWLWIKENLL